MGNLSICGLFNIIGILVMVANITVFIAFFKISKEIDWETPEELIITLGLLGLQIIVLFILIKHHMIHSAL